MKEKEIERLTKLKEIEKDLYSKGFKNICGIDEAGRGPLAGPVVVAGVIMPENSMIEFVNDSKKVTEKRREKLYDVIMEEAISYSIAVIDQDVIDEMNNQSKETLQEFNFSKTASDVLEISPQSISKGNALKIIAKKMNIASCEIMAIGDQENDIEMLKFADVSVAMGNAIDKVKKIANYHTSSNDEDGVAKAIEMFALKQEG